MNVQGSAKLKNAQNFVKSHYGLTMLYFCAFGFLWITTASFLGGSYRTLMVWSVMLITSIFAQVFSDDSRSKKFLVATILGVFCIVFAEILLPDLIFDSTFISSVLAAGIGSLPLFVAGCFIAFKEWKN